MIELENHESEELFLVGARAARFAVGRGLQDGTTGPELWEMAAKVALNRIYIELALAATLDESEEAEFIKNVARAIESNYPKSEFVFVTFVAGTIMDNLIEEDE